MMASFGIRLQSLLVVALWSIISFLMGSTEGRDYTVGDKFGWQDNGTDYNYQKWASSQSFTINDTLSEYIHSFCISPPFFIFS